MGGVFDKLHAKFESRTWSVVETAEYFLLLKVLKTLTDSSEKKIEITYVLHTVTFEYQSSILPEGVKRDLGSAF